MPLYELVLEQSYAGQQIINRFNYVGSGTPAAVSPSFALLSAFGALAVTTTLLNTTLAGKIQLLQNAGVLFAQSTARAVYVDDDFYGNGFLAGTAGLRSDAGQLMPPTVAYGFRSNRVKQSINRGMKRFVGVGINMLGSEGVIGAAAATYVEAVRAALGATLSFDDEGNTLTFVPCVVQKEKYTTPSGKFAYRYYATEALQAPHIASGITWESYTQTRTQNSRQYGRGA